MKKVLYLFREDEVQFFRGKFGKAADQFFLKKKVGFGQHILQYSFAIFSSFLTQQCEPAGLYKCMARRRTDRRTAFFYQVRY